MKILFCVRHNFHSSPGGAQIQILKTKYNLEEMGVNCDITISPYDIDYNKYDIVHLTDLTWVYDNLVYLKEINKQGFKGKKVLSTIYWPFDDYAEHGAPLFQKFIYKLFGVNGFEFFKAFAKYIVKRERIYLQGLRNSYINNQRMIAGSMDWLLPNAELEMQALNTRLNLDLRNYTVIYNAIDINVFNKIKEENKIKKDESLITFVARIDPRKNQLKFLEAMMNSDFKIRFIGSAGPNSMGYFIKLKKLAQVRGNVEFISHIPQEEVFKHMLKAKVNVLTSWIETPGLVSIEAAYANCNIVISDKGSVKEYFQDYAYYCDPNDMQNIKEQTSLAMTNNFNDRVLSLIQENYSWQKTAKDTYNSYLKVLNA